VTIRANKSPPRNPTNRFPDPARFSFLTPFWALSIGFLRVARDTDRARARNADRRGDVSLVLIGFSTAAVRASIESVNGGAG
jgi:hypothetical protein